VGVAGPEEAIKWLERALWLAGGARLSETLHFFADEKRRKKEERRRDDDDDHEGCHGERLSSREVSLLVKIARLKLGGGGSGGKGHKRRKKGGQSGSCAAVGAAGVGAGETVGELSEARWCLGLALCSAAPDSVGAAASLKASLKLFEKEDKQQQQQQQQQQHGDDDEQGQYSRGGRASSRRRAAAVAAAKKHLNQLSTKTSTACGNKSSQGRSDSPVALIGVGCFLTGLGLGVLLLSTPIRRPRWR
jgi:hypothetical protein